MENMKSPFLSAFLSEYLPVTSPQKSASALPVATGPRLRGLMPRGHCRLALCLGDFCCYSTGVIPDTELTPQNDWDSWDSWCNFGTGGTSRADSPTQHPVGTLRRRSKGRN